MPAIVALYLPLRFGTGDDLSFKAAAPRYAGVSLAIREANP